MVPKLYPLVFSVFLPCDVRVRLPLVFSGTPNLHPLVFSVFFLRFFAAGRIHDPRISEKKMHPLSASLKPPCFVGRYLDRDHNQNGNLLTGPSHEIFLLTTCQ